MGKAALNRTRNLIYQANCGLDNPDYDVPPYKGIDGSPLNRKNL
jgi:hypothetical protein